jgi:hypothetical protein
MIQIIGVPSGLRQNRPVRFFRVFPGVSVPRVFVIGSAFLFALAAAAVAQLPTTAEHEAIAYSSSTPTDAVARLQQRIDSGEVTLTFDETRGYLPSLLASLDIPVSTQGLVFSRTSLQLDRIAPWSPRAIYFNDDVYVGWVQGGPIIEIASADPKLGAVFYSLAQDGTVRPKFERETQTCLVCHDSSSVTGGVPGFIIRSVIPDRYGYGLAPVGKSVTSDQTPLGDRWGGWYITGTHGTQQHMGNVIAPVLSHEVGNMKSYLATAKLPPGGNVTDLGGRLDLEPYMTLYSDLVAMMVIAHQVNVHNLITRAGYEGRVAAREGSVSEARIRTVGEPLVRAMLFAKEAPLSGPLKGTSGFAEEFVARGPRDAQGRSLRDFDLERRVFRYPLSYLIYSESFDALPAAVQDYVYRRLREILNGEDRSPDFAHLSAADRQAILGILEDTKPAFGSRSRTAE